MTREIDTVDVSAQQPKLEEMGELYKRPRHRGQGVLEEQCKEQKGRLRKLFNQCCTGSKCKRRVGGKDGGGGGAGKLEVARGPHTCLQCKHMITSFKRER